MPDPLFTPEQYRAAAILSAAYRFIAGRERAAERYEERAAALLARAAEERRLAAERREAAEAVRKAAGFRERRDGSR
ncbi:MAG: hypothetical protein KF809_04120 [Chloroflexi bacterium]|nr:hypothetical protein [Chloroflexota bacterium]